MVNKTAGSVPWWQPVLFAAMAGGMGWGIRGQYGHETGAMIAGLLVSLTLVYLLCPRGKSLALARAVAMGTVAMGFGGSMTYGQTLGLTQNPSMIGNHAALWWGLLGTAIKGGIWIGFAGAFLGMGLSGVKYRSREVLLLMLGLLVAYAVGIWLLNSPFDPANKRLPLIYFSADWRWEPDAELKPRFECWGGLLLALASLAVYTGCQRKDALAPRLALFGVLGGAIGFPLGQSLQAFHAWNPQVFQAGIWEWLDPHMNWWNMMETTFGATMGAVLGLGLWLNRGRIVLRDDTDSPLPVEWGMLGAHLLLLAWVEFAPSPGIESIYDLGLVMGILPMVGIVGGRWWPYLAPLPVTLLPIAGKTVRQLVYEEGAINAFAGWTVYLALPMVIVTAAAIVLAQKREEEYGGSDFARPLVLLCGWLYFLLNYAFFRFPWPWAEWTSRTPNGIIFTVCVIGLTVMALATRGAESVPESTPPQPSS